MKPLFSATIPLKATGSQNARQHWAVKARQVKKERSAAMLATARLPALVRPALVVTLTRVGPRLLDAEDNLTATLKAVRDGVAARLKVDDASPLIRWEYRQEKGEYAVRVEVREDIPANETRLRWERIADGELSEEDLSDDSVEGRT